MSDDKIYCAKLAIPFLDDCMTMAEWGVNWQAVGIVVALLTMLGGAWKIWKELSALRLQRSTDSLLKRAEFFLTQHRLLFDNPDLFEVLQYIDDDDPRLAPHPMWDKKRKFLTFIEEIALLTSTNLINPNVGYYMFGYYAIHAKNGKNFMNGIDADPIHWRVFFEFCEKAGEFFNKQKDGVEFDMKL